MTRRNLMTMVMALLAWTGMYAMDYETARERAYYLTDKMAYELNLNDQQYNDAYEINLDYLLSINTEADLADARYLAYRNEDLRHILYDWQWTAFAAVDYLFRPLWWRNGGWFFPVFDHYAHGYFFYHRPTIFWDYRGGHGRFHYAGGFYLNRRPMWHGGLRGMNRGMVGHPNGPGRERYGHPGGTGFGRPGEGRGRGGFRPDNQHHNGGSMGGQRPGGQQHNGSSMGGQRPGGQRDNGGSMGGARPNGNGGISSSSRSSMTNPSRGSSMGGTRGGSMSSGRSTMGSPRSSMGGSRGSAGSSSGSRGGGRGRR